MCVRVEVIQDSIEDHQDLVRLKGGGFAPDLPKQLRVVIGQWLLYVSGSFRNGCR